MSPSHISTKKFKCYCLVCRIKAGEYNIIFSQTLKCHKRDEQIAIRGQTNRFEEIPEVVSHNEIHFEYENNEYDIVYVFRLNDSIEEIEMSAQIKDLSLSESNAVFGIKGNEYAASNNFDGKEDESDDNMSDDKGLHIYSNNESVTVYCMSPVFGSNLFLLDVNSVPFVNNDHSIMFTFNIDQFQPFDGKTYSCGIITPKSKESSKSDINNYLKPLVDELELLYKGMKIRTHQHLEDISIHDALFMVACDIPATRKYTIVNLMHNLFLRTTKIMMDRWVADGIINNKKLAAMQKSVKKIVLPPDYMMLQNKIGK
ncbi:hypothetical protein PHYBLDRAFT_72167 [Phycomyces blakesleeanus NRRL 1555(-)]|uniref:Uncharacterized protein n=1 Tax=Phycomyces blakesleeanus (strain ATCC 8743b / DSM 1359 / FGSC 10004 / NBRC 33097 / NRRL 1555) TaxID=763407 RepID=A0A167KCI0_PHYB8|nr:hypothetical protein PHYBLDRAFT_72167 [Phycomyces blakesleeanus NRRL 1555(-)]OAD67757.1 hypothetical protein PHYBLDRAFT_72167 [Phycomyces blakesleeanus NRRL 1555(-)]|eukprot:XP_018285797.1 hypothetical protein PHYBLDRAFT_72167 [Phycomyces blakesleeanus NRRL 1555(-)]